MTRLYILLFFNIIKYNKMNKDELCEELGLNTKKSMNSIKDECSMTFNGECQKCKNIMENFSYINHYYNIDKNNRLENMISTISKFDNNKLRIFAIEIYNVLNQAQEKEKEKEKNNDFRTESTHNIRTIENILETVNFSKTLSKENENYYFKTINNYILLEELGRGNQGIVYFALDEKTNEKFAIKEISNRKRKSIISDNNPSSNLKKEIAIMKKAEHENIVKLYDVIESLKEKKIYLVMQYIDSGSLFEKIKINNNCEKFNPLSLDKVIKYTLQLISGLRYLHHNNIIHRDIKPENILLDKNDRIYLSDFGVSDILKKKRDSITNKNGTVMYFPPEMFLLGAVVNGPSVDIWALGVTIFIMLYGYFPFNGNNYEELKNNILNNPPNYPENINNKEKDFFNKIFAKDQTSRISLKDMKHHIFMKSYSHMSKIKTAIEIANNLEKDFYNENIKISSSEVIKSYEFNGKNNSLDSDILEISNISEMEKSILSPTNQQIENAVKNIN
jgi:serine/threonine protein kinase